jgi:hypothetical protein
MIVEEGFPYRSSKIDIDSCFFQIILNTFHYRVCESVRARGAMVVIINIMSSTFFGTMVGKVIIVIVDVVGNLGFAFRVIIATISG